MDLSGKVAIVTGASRGIDEAIALELAHARGQHRRDGVRDMQPSSEGGSRLSYSWIVGHGPGSVTTRW